MLFIDEKINFSIHYLVKLNFYGPNFAPGCIKDVQMMKELRITGGRGGISSTMNLNEAPYGHYTYLSPILVPKDIEDIPGSFPGLIEQATTWSTRKSEYDQIFDVNFDDGVTFIVRLKKAERDAKLKEIKDALVSKNSNLLFGITLYEDEMNPDDFDRFVYGFVWAQGMANTFQFNRVSRELVDVVHLAFHNRTRSLDYEYYVKLAKERFPRAYIIAALYHQDRRKYEAREFHSQEKEVSMYRESLQQVCELYKAKKIDGIEFYPGRFDTLEELKISWNLTDEEYDTTIQMREITKQIMGECFEE